jgi:MFS transporter, ACS family, hexuronate transporter
VIAGLLLLATTINYIDRLTLSVVITDVRKEFLLTEQDYSQIVSFFLIAYAIMYAGSGYIVDRLGTRRGFAAFIGVWSLAQMLHGLCRGKWSLVACRGLLGATEPGNFPAAVKAIAEWFPASQRAIGVGIFNAGSSLGAAMAAPIAAFMTLKFGWRFAFLFTGAMGILWLLLWLLLYQPPHLCRWLSAKEYADIKGRIQPPEQAKPKEKVVWYRVLQSRQCWTLILARFLTDPVIYFMIFWLPEYLRKERGFDLVMVGKFAWMPFVFGDIGYIVGGWFSGKLIQAGWTLPRARKFVMASGAVLMPAAILAPLAPSAGLAIAATCVVIFGHAVWVANLLTLPADMFRGSEIGTATGWSGTGGAIGGILANLGTGYVVSRFSYFPIFALAGVMHPLAIFLIYRLLPERVFQKELAA